jgi:hypothetical protein
VALPFLFSAFGELLAMINNYRWTFKNERYDMAIKYRRGKVGKGGG